MAPHHSESSDPHVFHASTPSKSKSSQIQHDQTSSKPFQHINFAQTLPKLSSSKTRANQTASQASRPLILDHVLLNPSSDQIRLDQARSKSLSSSLKSFNKYSDSQITPSLPSQYSKGTSSSSRQ
ncbi:hypothetical protein EV360DRAFT_90506 [Lentinula raphanica]|nr:hypothetical protein EV360DRAFT_90506 [Lentinula raphanica]